MPMRWSPRLALADYKHPRRFVYCRVTPYCIAPGFRPPNLRLIFGPDHCVTKSRSAARDAEPVPRGSPAMVGPQPPRALPMLHHHGPLRDAINAPYNGAHPPPREFALLTSAP